MRFGRSDRILVVGAGAAGLAAAAQVRRLGFPGQVVVLGDEECGPYDRPACSKGLITGHQIPKDVRLPLPEDVHVELGRRAVALDPDAHTVTVDSGHEYVYDGLVIATGGTASLPKGWPLARTGGVMSGSASARSCTNTSCIPLVSPGTRLVAREVNATKRPSVLIAGLPLLRSP